MDNTINPKNLFQIVYKKRFLLMTITGLFVGLMAIYLSFLATPIYQSSTQLVVSQQKIKNLQTQDVQADLNLVNTYSAIIKSPRILNRVQSILDTQSNLKELTNEVTVTTTQDSQVIDIQVENKNPKKATQIANSIAKVSKTEIPQIMGVDNVTILSTATFDQNNIPIRPRKALMVILSFVLGLAFSLGVIFVQTVFDKTINDINDLRQFDINILGSVSELK
ncbi:capsular biosynthesis protein [Lactobacillus curvatus]|nr:capsular biosynthesis protein [Latilactobacillus curvatus]MSE24062.1 capsular biosynthesis protein [Latilactobacillus curvatus]